MSPGRAAAVTGAVVLAAWTVLGWRLAGSGDSAPTVVEAASTVGFVGLPYVVAAMILAHRVVRAARGPDLPARVVAVATAGRPRGVDWGAALRAELAHIDGRAGRWRFAAGCVEAALVGGSGRLARATAVPVFVVFAVLTFAGSRFMLAGQRVGLLAGIYLVALAVGAVAAAVGWAGRSFRAGLVSGATALAAGLAGVVAVAAIEAVTWYQRAGVWIIDGDVPAGGIASPGAAVTDAVVGMTSFGLLFALPFPVLGAALGAAAAGAAAAVRRRVSAGSPSG
ncbi:hypothetical protein [Jiangella mangrovi]|uniref:Uncharacterized protein n=1 Tax=Jiangella mangrovi TaxID=1524084 RepID=A0A7W9LJ61_9ACTN|nr:hypothetical protein [Jiangella mangrovi]MBB5785713.1 hypothetical protein [Jiangella mangrovi]